VTWLCTAEVQLSLAHWSSGGAPDSVRCARLASGEQATLGKYRRRMAIIHRTVRWCTGLCCAQLLWMRQTLRDFGYNLSKVSLLCDNESAIHMVDNPVEHSRTKHIHICHHFLRDHQQKGDIEVFHISTENQLADIFTKPLDEKTFCRLRSELNVLDSRNLD
jgi:hypothetical protein